MYCYCQKKDQNGEIDHTQQDNDKKCKEIIGWTPLGTAQQEKRKRFLKL